MKLFSDLLVRIMPRVNGAAEPVAIDAARRAAQEFCEATRLWRYTDSLKTSEDGDDIMVAIGESEIVEIESSRFNGNPLTPAALVWLDEKVPDWRSLKGDGAKWITQTEPDAIQLVPRSVGTLDVTLILKPSDDAESLPSWMVDKYARVIADGALADLMMLPGQSFSNPSLASVHLQRFQSSMDRLASQGYQGQQRAAVRSKPFFF